MPEISIHYGNNPWVTPWESPWEFPCHVLFQHKYKEDLLCQNKYNWMDFLYNIFQLRINSSVKQSSRHERLLQLHYCAGSLAVSKSCYVQCSESE